MEEVQKRIVEVPYPEETKGISNPIKPTDDSLEIGKGKYTTFCSMCHGADGGGAQEVTRNFEVDPSSLITESVKKRTDGELFWATSNGVNNTNMLPWKDLLSDKEIWHIVNYVRLLQKES